ncbi:MAG: hypothetical protein Q8Q26_04100 [Pseudorhodobacter sp.]|nr:hypothetical protein [Pseudorhodobacter sp.]
MIFDPVLDLFRGKAVTIPPLDGAFRPNTALDDAPVFASLPAPDNLVFWQGRVVASSGPNLMAPGGEVLHRYGSDITALAVSSSGALAVGLEDGSLTIAGAAMALPTDVRCITALAYGPDGRLWLANGSATLPPGQWAADLMQKNASGSVWVQEDGWQKMAGGLAWPYGLLPDGMGAIVSESWRHRLVGIEGGKALPVMESLPGYPARLAPAAGGGAWLALFAPRNRLIEFVLQETRYRHAMMAEVPPEFWIAPALASGRSFLEPLQCGGIRMLGVHKAWSPSRSYGLVVRLDAALIPQFSLHSRANGTRHGVTSVLDHQGQLYIASKGGDCILTGGHTELGST